MALAETTGTLPAVTDEQVAAWNKLANDVTAALQMGGEPGMDLLTNIMADWCEAVDDVNSARQIIVDLADRGLRHEAIDWHAEGFFEAADRLDPNRPGWEAWEAALEERAIVTPHVDQDLREAANRIHDDLELRDLAGRSLGEYIGQLRANVLIRGHLGERRLLLESIRGLDPGGIAWQDMVSPLRKMRAGKVEAEAREAIASRDFETLAKLRAEVTAVEGWQDDVPSTLVAILEAASHWETVGETRRQLSAIAATIVDLCHNARGQPPNSASEAAAVQSANDARDHYRSLRQTLVEAANVARGVPELADVVAEAGVAEAVKQLDAAVADQFRYLDQVAAEALRQAAVADLEAEIHAHLKSQPAVDGELERCRPLVKQWRQKAVKVEKRARRKASTLGGGLPQSTRELLDRLEVAGAGLEERLRQKRRAENLVVGLVIGGIAAVVLLLIIIIVVGSILGG